MTGHWGFGPAALSHPGRRRGFEVVTTDWADSTWASMSPPRTAPWPAIWNGMDPDRSVWFCPPMTSPAPPGFCPAGASRSQRLPEVLTSIRT